MLAFYPCPPLLSRVPPDRHAVIEASAGTGKTYTIEHLVVDRLIGGVPLDSILVVTFTDKATGELRARIRNLVTEVLAQAPGPAPDGPAWRIDAGVRQRLEDALFAFDRAPIYTIHGFCHRVLSDMAFESGQLFELEIIDSHRAFNRAWREALRTEIARQHAGLLRTWLDNHEENALERLLFQARQQRYLDGWVPLDERLPQLLTDLREALDIGAYVTDLAGVAIQRKAFEATEPALRALSAVLDGDGTPAEQLDAVARLDLKVIMKPPRTSTRGGKRAFPGELAPRSKAVLHRLDALLTARTLAGSIERAVVDAFLPVVQRFLDRFKRREGVLDYDDLLDRVWGALLADDAGTLRQTLRGRYRCAFIDEFQDTDGRQWDIFRRVFVEDAPGHTLTIIGDPKQAIYGFRGADVHTYLRARAELQRRGAVKLTLDVNYRSSGGVIAAANAILDQTAKPPFFDGAIVYDTPVRCGRETLRLVDGHDADQPAVVLWRYKPKPPGPRSRTTLPKYELQAAYAAQLGESLDRLLNRDEGALFIKQGDAPRRRIGPKDVFVLVRGGWDAVDAAAALRARGIPYAFYKQEGLFQTREARDVREVLQAVREPQSRSARMRAFATPFFAIDWAGLRDYAELPGGHPLLERLYSWAQLGVHERFATLFHRLMHESGLVERALFLDETERELCNYQHIFEVLLEHVARRKLSLAECVELLDRFIDGTEMPEGGQSNVQRLPNERDAVQIMTIHKSKGLEAPVVCLFGGFGGYFKRAVNVVHDAGGERRVLIGEAARLAHVERLAREARQEDQRLLYVALTRAKARVYLPQIDSSRELSGAYRPLKDRLFQLTKGAPLDAMTWTHPQGQIAPLFHTLAVPDEPTAARRRRREPKEPIDAWSPPATLMVEADDADDFSRLRQRSAPMQVTSYTRLKEDGMAPQVEVDPVPVERDEFKVDAPAEPTVEDEAVLPGGRHVGRFLHEVIESLDFGPFERRQAFKAWARDSDAREVFMTCMRRHGVDPQWLAPAQALIYDALATPIRLGDHTVDGLARCRHAVELEFLYPIPEASHPLLDSTIEASAWTATRGFVKGFIDYIFEHEGRIYFADWKSDILPDYGHTTLDAHVASHYALQARLYSLGVVRWLQIRDAAQYDARFGGLLYLFLRGQNGEGVWFERPTWDDIVAWEADLLRLGQ